MRISACLPVSGNCQYFFSRTHPDFKKAKHTLLLKREPGVLSGDVFRIELPVIKEESVTENTAVGLDYFRNGRIEPCGQHFYRVNAGMPQASRAFAFSTNFPRNVYYDNDDIMGSLMNVSVYLAGSDGLCQNGPHRGMGSWLSERSWT